MALFTVFSGGHAPAAESASWPTTVHKQEVKKSVTPKWLDRLLIGFILAIPVLYACGISLEIGPSMNHLGLIYVVDWGTMPTEPGQVIRLAPAHLPAWRKHFVGSMVKRFTGFTPDGRLMYEGDNPEWSHDNRDDLEPVSADHVAGVVTNAWSPRRMIRWFSIEGRLKNWVELHYPPTSTHWVAGCGVVEMEGVVHILKTGRTIDLPGKYAGIDGTTVRVWNPSKAKVIEYECQTDQSSFILAQRVDSGDLEVKVKKGKRAGIQTILSDKRLDPPFRFAYKSEVRKVERVVPVPDAKDGRPGVMFGVFPPLDVEDGEAIKITMMPPS